MKKVILLLVQFLLLVTLGYTQTSDVLWLIKNGIGKNRMSGNENYYPTTDPNFRINGPSFTMDGVKHATALFAKNDIFIIYSDDTYLNTRNNINLFSPHGTTIDTKHQFTIPGNKNIVSLYMTRIYEDEDEPSRVSVKNENLQGAVPIYNIPPSPINTLTISANHNVVRQKDITLIVDLNKLRNHTSDDNGTISQPDLSLKFNSIINVSTRRKIILDTIFQPTNLFNNGRSWEAGFPSRDYKYTAGADSVNINLSYPDTFLFINLRPRTALYPYFPQSYNVPLYDALFEIVNNQTHAVVASLSEHMLDSFDPNFVRVDSICRDTNGDQYVYYHIQFQNDGNGFVQKFLSVELKFPNQIDNNCIVPTEWSVGGEKVNGTACFFNAYKFKFDLHAQSNGKKVSLIGCGSIIPNKTKGNCVGYLNIRVKYPKSYDVSNVKNPLVLIDPKVYFDGSSKAIETFIDLIDCDNSNDSDSQDHMHYYRPISNCTSVLTCPPIGSCIYLPEPIPQPRQPVVH